MNQSQFAIGLSTVHVILSRPPLLFCPAEGESSESATVTIEDEKAAMLKSR